MRPDGGANEQFDVVSCLNVLDRVDYPTTLLRQLRAVVKPDGVVLLAVVLPFCPCVLTPGLASRQRLPAERLDVPGCCDGSVDTTWESSFVKLLDVIRGAGFEVLRWTRLPYISKGSNMPASSPLAVLSDAVMVLSPTTSDAGTQL